MKTLRLPPLPLILTLFLAPHAHAQETFQNLGFEVTFAGNAIPLAVLSSQAGYTVYGGDLGPFAGQTGELRITSYSH